MCRCLCAAFRKRPERKTFRVVSLKVLPASTVNNTPARTCRSLNMFSTCVSPRFVSGYSASAYCVQFPTALSDNGAAFVRNDILRRYKLKNVLATGAHAAGESNVSRRIRTRWLLLSPTSKTKVGRFDIDENQKRRVGGGSRISFWRSHNRNTISQLCTFFKVSLLTFFFFACSSLFFCYFQSDFRVKHGHVSLSQTLSTHLELFLKFGDPHVSPL